LVRFVMCHYLVNVFGRSNFFLNFIPFVPRHPYPWMVPLKTSHLDFPKPIKLWKIIGITQMNIDQNKFWINLLGSIDFEISITLRILCILMFLTIAFTKSLRNVTLVFFLDLFGKNTNLEHDLWIFLWIFF